MLRAMLASGLAGMAVRGVTQATAANSPLLVIAVALLGGGLAAAAVSAWARRRSGEDRGAAAESVARGALENAEAAQGLVAPLQRQVLELTRQNAELEGKVAAARRESYERALAAADREKDILQIQRETEAQHILDRAELHECRSELAAAAVERVQLLDRITTLEVQLGKAPERRTDERRTT